MKTSFKISQFRVSDFAQNLKMTDIIFIFEFDLFHSFNVNEKKLEKIRQFEDFC